MLSCKYYSVISLHMQENVHCYLRYKFCCYCWSEVQNSWHQLTQATKCCKVAPNIFSIFTAVLFPDKSLDRPTSRCILFDGENISFDAGLVLYTGCPRRKGPNFGRVFLRSNYTDITQNTYIQSSMVTEILNIEK